MPFKIPPKDVEHLMVTLRALRDELRLQVNLLKLDGQSGARAVADAVEDLAQRLERAKDTGELKSHLAWMEARDRFVTIEPALARALDAVRRTGDAVADALPLEAARLQVSLAAMDAKDAVDERAKRVSADLHKAERAAHDAIVDLKARVAPFARAVGSIV